MNESTIKILYSEGIKFKDVTCCVCYEKFIDIKCGDLFDLYEKITEEKKYNSDEKELYDESCALSYYDRFECLTCKNKVCYGCIMKMPDQDDEECDNYDVRKDTMEESGRITCPICRTKDFRLKLTRHLNSYCGARGGVLPEEIIYSIKNNINLKLFQNDS